MPARSGPGPDPCRSYLLRLPLALALAMAVWLALRPALDRTVPALAEVGVRAFEVPRVTRLVPREHLLEVRRSDFRAGSRIPTLSLTEVHFNTLVLLALCGALPRPLSSRRLERLLMGLGLLLLVQALNLAFEVESLYATRLGEWSLTRYSPLERNLWGFLQYFTDLPGRFSAPFVIWLGCNWEVVRRLLGPAPQGAAAEGKGARPRRGSKGRLGAYRPRLRKRKSGMSYSFILAISAPRERLRTRAAWL